MQQHLFVGCFPTGLVYADTSREEHGDYKKVGYLSYSTLMFEVHDPKSPLLAEAKAHAATIQAKRGESFKIAGNMSVTLGEVR